MASGSGDLPPALPVKQHRSRSSRCSSVESDSVLLSPIGPNYAHNEVFSELTHCHAARCPIHQRYDPSPHQARFFSDGTPPPVPKKRLVRTFSLPATEAPPLSPLPPPSPLQRQPQNFDNPLYMLAPMSYTHFHGETEEFEPVRGSPVSSLSLAQLSFDTPDEHLPYIFSSFDNQKVVLQEIQHRHLLSLRSMAQRLEAGILLQREATEGDINSYQPQDFLLCDGSKPKQIGGMLYYSVHSPKHRGRVFGVRLHTQTDETSSHTRHQLTHVNVRDVITHFQPRNALVNDSSKPQTQETHLKLDSSAAISKGRNSTEFSEDCMNLDLCSVQSFLQKGHSVSIERDLPHATLEDYVQESRSLRREGCLDRDRQVCVVLLQVLMGALHLFNISATAAELRPQGIFLVWPNREKEDRQWEKTGRKEEIQMSWRTCGSPRVVLTPLSSSQSVSHPLNYTKSQIIALIQYCLGSQESALSSYRTGLLHLSSLLQSEHSTLQVADMVIMLQVLLWGPRVPLFSPRGSMTMTLHNWLTIKRALLVMKFAEGGLMPGGSDLDWEDCMCLQYLSFTDPEILVSMAGQLWLTVNLE
ncbi:inactive tyrosine-protein kinase PEAK1 [Cheilinus undulatus]|uniref:inactive tyrosine-protein kinase PEAK1 n=1 Tax=Cheilinus undulatus TaxID=241271 RepID=UPI001BD1F16F|nr:inactive tyrosine-protein kinase PEAK1 [Cheilinus undulatus]